ncbi:MAG TPA: FHA domain-containing protein [Kineosporiaceae bacterium]
MPSPSTPSPDRPPDQAGTPGLPSSDTTQLHGIVVPDLDAWPCGDLSREHRAAIDALPAGSALLVVHRGPQAGARFLLNTPATSAGRHPQRDIFLDDATVSRKHAVFVQRAGGFAVQDEGSLNGTYVNGVSVSEAQLRAGDEIRIGKFRLTFHPSPRGAG